MDKNEKIAPKVLIILVIYILIQYFGGEIGRKIMYPINLLVTFLHEFGHALGALISGGSVLNLQINSDGSGFTRTAGGSRGLILAGGYLGSALLGNILFYIGAKKASWAKGTLWMLGVFMLIAAFLWYNSIYSTAFLVGFALVLHIITQYSNYSAEVLMFFGMASIIYIIQDFNVGPSSDLEQYAKHFKLIPATVWMYIWLGVALLFTFFNLKLLFRKGTNS